MNRGFTLIELLVSIVLISLTMGAVVGIFVSAIHGQTRSLASQQLVNQASYLLEYTSRAIRMAKKDNLAGDCTGTPYLNYVKTEGGEGIKFLDYHSKCHEFRLDGVKFQERESVDETDDSFESWIDVTSDQVEVLDFNVGPDDSWDQDDNYQSRVSLYFDIRGNAAGLETNNQPRIKIQATVSQRNLDYHVE